MKDPKAEEEYLWSETSQDENGNSVPLAIKLA